MANVSPDRIGEELQAERTAASETFELADGKRLTRLYSAPIHYRDSNGTYSDIEERLSLGADGKPRNGANAFDVVLPERLGVEAARIEVGGEWVSSRLLDHSSGDVSVVGTKASYQTGREGLGVDLTSTPTGLKEEIVLDDPSQPTSFEFELRASAGLTPTLTEEGSIEFRDEKQKPVVILPAPLTSDSARAPVTSADARYRLDPGREAGSWNLVLEAERDWIEAEERTWPVRFDPTLNVPSPLLDCTIAYNTGQGGQGWNYCGSTGAKLLRAELKPGSSIDWRRALIRFSLGPPPVIPTNSAVSDATVGLYAPSAVENTSGVELRRVAKNWTSAANWIRYGPLPFINDWSQPGGDYLTDGAEVLTSERGAQAGWWLFSDPTLTHLANLWVANSGSATAWGLLAKLRDDKECTGEGCSIRSAVFWNSATSEPPYLDLVYYPPAPSTSKLTSPSEGTRTARRLKLASTWHYQADMTGVTFQYRIGKSDFFKKIPASAVTDASGEAVSWPLDVSGKYSSPPVFFDTTAVDEALKESGGEIQVRALFDGPPGSLGYSKPVNAKVNRSIGGTLDATSDVGPGSLSLLTGNFTVSRTDVSIPTMGASLEFARTHSSRGYTGSSADTKVMGRGWVPSAPVEEAGGSQWRNLREILANAEEQEEGFDDYVLLTDSEGYEYAFEKSGANTFTTPPGMTGWELYRLSGTQIALTDPDGNRTVFTKNESGTEYLPSSVTQTGGENNKTKLDYDFVDEAKRLNMVIGPSSVFVPCDASNATSYVGCRALKFNYLPASTWGAPGSFKDRLASITYYGPKNASQMGSWTVAQ